MIRRKLHSNAKKSSKPYTYALTYDYIYIII